MRKAIITIAVIISLIAATTAYAEGPPIPLPAPLALVVEVEQVSDEACIISTNIAKWFNAEYEQDYSKTGWIETHSLSSSSPLSVHKLKGILEPHYVFDRHHTPESTIHKILNLNKTISQSNEYQHTLHHSYVIVKSGGRSSVYPHTIPFNWTTNQTNTEITEKIRECQEELHLQYDTNLVKQEADRQRAITETELAIAQSALEHVREQERIKTELVIELIRLNTEILDIVIATENLRLTGLERRAELMREAAERDATRWDEWMLASGHRLDTLESMQQETAAIIAESKARQDEYFAEIESVKAQQNANLQAAEQNLADAQRKVEELSR